MPKDIILDRETEKQRNRETEKQRNRETEKQRNRETEKLRNRPISLFRLIAFISIIICHLCQAYRLELAWWLNIGVQIFLCISGYLYGKKAEIKMPDFYIQRLRKLLIPYYCILIPIIIVELIFKVDSLGIKDILSALLIKGTIRKLK